MRVKVTQGDKVESNTERSWVSGQASLGMQHGQDQNVMREEEEEGIPLLGAFSLLGLTWLIPLSTHSFHFCPGVQL